MRYSVQPKVQSELESRQMLLGLRRTIELQ